jgi:beta-galactosidase
MPDGGRGGPAPHSNAAQAQGPGRILHGADYNYEQWLNRPEVLEEDFRLMRSCGFTTVTVGIFSWARLEPAEGRYDFSWMDGLMDRLAAEGLGAILATPSGSKPAWLSRAYPESCRMDEYGRREPHGGRHNHCRSSKAYRAKCVEINRCLAKRYGSHPALLMWHASNEYNAGRCYCPACLDAFRAWLRRRYRDLETLNRAWWTDFWSHRFSDWEEIFPADPSIHGMMLDWARFTSDQTIDFFLEETAPLRELSPGVPVTTNFMQPDVGIDYAAFARHVDLVSWDSYPRWHAEGDDPGVAARTAFFHDFFRSLKGKPFLLMESTPSCTNWQGLSPLKRPGMHLLSSMQAVAHGSDSVHYFQWRRSRGGEEKFHGAVVGSGERVLREVAETGRALERVAGLAGADAPAQAAIVYDLENAWALDLAQLPRNVGKGYQEECLAHYRALWERGVGVDVIDSRAIGAKPYKLIAAPMLYLLKPGVARALEAFVDGGGILLATYLSGLADESDLCFEEGAPGPLADLLGLRVEETDALPEHSAQALSWLDGQGRPAPERFHLRHFADFLRLQGARALAVYREDYQAGTPALTVNRRGRGQAWYQAARAGVDFLKELYARLCGLAGPERAFPWDLPAGVSVRSREWRGGRAVMVMNFNPHPVRAELGGARYEDHLGGTRIEGILELEPYGVRLLTAL